MLAASVTPKKSASLSNEGPCKTLHRKSFFSPNNLFLNSKERPTNRHQAAAYLELRPVLEVVVPRQAGVELHPVARDPGDLLAAPELGVTQQGCPLIDIMPSPLQSAST